MGTRVKEPLVLIVDDDKELDNFLKEFYSKMDYRVMIAMNADRAIRWADQNRGKPTVALIDIGLPGALNGIQLITHLTSYAPHVACFVITGESGEALHRRAKWAGAVDVFVKPLDADDLLRAVESPLIPRLITTPISDFLTGLQIRRVFEDVASRQILSSRRRKEPLSLLFLDVNKFKEINDTFGHELGDEALRLVASAIRENLRVYDHSCRYGGDEFIILLPGVKKSDAEHVAETLKNAVARRKLVTDGEANIALSVSVGVATLIPEDRDIADFIRRADEAMYEDKAKS